MADKKSTVGERIQIFRKEHLKLTQQGFAHVMHTTQANVSQIEKGVCSPGAQFVDRLVREYPELNLNWLFYSQGSVLRSEPEPLAGHGDLTLELERAKQQIALLQEEVATLRRNNTALIDILHRQASPHR